MACSSAAPRCRDSPPDPLQQGGQPLRSRPAKAAGKTVTRRLAPTEAALYQEWIANDRQLRHIVADMRKVAPTKPKTQSSSSSTATIQPPRPGAARPQPPTRSLNRKAKSSKEPGCSSATYFWRRTPRPR